MTTNSGQNYEMRIENVNENGPGSYWESGRYCWVCFASDEEDQEAAWVQPCKCRGTTKWVHQACLQRWFDEKQKMGTRIKVSCPQCKTEYIVVYPNMGVMVYLLDKVDDIIYKWCPFMAAGVVVGGVYWCGVTYGAITVMQVLGRTEGLALLEKTDPILLIIVLPAIPLVLILGKVIRWEDILLGFIRKNITKIPLIRSFPSFRPNVANNPNRDYYDFPIIAGPFSATRILCGALLLPTVAAFFGKLFFKSVKSDFHKTILGGLTFIALKGCLRIYHNQQNYIRKYQRQILDYVEPNISKYVKPE
ncbi:unnamed protein product [Ceutorhynchus assimilis]|uniref:E3 ubiquitin-protein ligase MARCHF5 n=1 Tax=Ceutorhynchus assimilis TaxID=467358 RepID=A0A9N9MEV9_9CUCU|nr:unnamed protein product [Ceutorhynchus assimilis]